MPEIGEPAPDFKLLSTRGELRLQQFARGKKLIIAFYASIGASACKCFVRSLRDEYDTIRSLGADVIAISTDTISAQYALDEFLGGCPFPLASDFFKDTTRVYGCMSEDEKHSLRAVFVVNADGKIVHKNLWYQPGNMAHFVEVFEALGLR